MQPIVPTILLPFCLRSGLKYRSLCGHAFTQSEKLYICQHLVDICGDEPEEFSRELDINIQDFCRKHSIKKGLIYNWMTAFANGEDFEESECVLDAIGIARMGALIAEGRQQSEGDQEYHQRLLIVLNSEIENAHERRA